MLKKSYLLVPASNEGNGTGHLRRMIDLYKGLKNRSEVSIFISQRDISEINKKLLENNVDQDDIYQLKLPKNSIWDFIVVDYRNSPNLLITDLAHRGFLIGIDEGYLNRAKFNYLIDIIPSLKQITKANIASTGLMNLPEKHLYKKSLSYNNILISFGGEDSLGLTNILLEFIFKYNYFSQSKITIAGCENIVSDKYLQSVTILSNENNLKNILYKFDLVFTSFGLTPFESLASGVPFLLLNPSSYHDKLSTVCGFPVIGTKIPKKKKVDNYLFNYYDYKSLQYKYIPEKYSNLKDLVLSINITDSTCPVCQVKCKAEDILHRYETRNFYKCPDCQIIFQVKFSYNEDSYKEAYFFEDYKNQYGKTYLEDFNNIQEFAKARLKIINSIRPVNKNGHINSSLLDIGCAYGPFLVESSNYGFLPQGVEIIPEAADYVRSEFGYEVFTGAFEDAVFEHQFDAVTMWYVMEHFTNPDYILTRVNKLLKPGGIFSFSTPNSSGISAKKKMSSFLLKSPMDHITIWNPKIADIVLRRYGFKIKKIRITGHHPERFSDFSKKNFSFINKIFYIISKIFKLGDTFEVYAVKVKEIDD